MSEPVEVRPVVSRRDLKAFVRLPWRIYAGDRLWVPPLISERFRYLEPSRGPFYRQADVALFIAWRGREPAGTIAAFVDKARNAHTGSSDGGFGFFEVVKDYEVAAKLLDACRAWLRDRGMTQVRGPTNFGDNDSPGILIAGTDYPPAMLEAHTPPWYQDFLERYGMRKDHDLYAWRATFDQVGQELGGGPSDLAHVAEAVERSGNVEVRGIRLFNWLSEVAVFRELFNATIGQIPDSVPLSEEEFQRFADEMKPFVDPDLALIAQVNGKPVGFCLMIPDTNRVLSRLNGRLFPFHWLLVKKWIREIDVISFKLMGILPEYRRRGIDALLYVKALSRAREKGYAWLDGSLTSELNPVVNVIAQSRGAEMYKHYRLYRMDA
jgi:GNAT superfamily N-acetyltransferase